MNENNILELFYRMLDNEKLKDIETFESVKTVERQVEELKKSIIGAFYDIQEYYFIQGYKANSELGEQLKRLLDNKSM